MSNCDDAFYEAFKDVTFQDDTAIHVWRLAWLYCSQQKGSTNDNN
jgi:hypothetical protein